MSFVQKFALEIFSYHEERQYADRMINIVGQIYKFLQYTRIPSSISNQVVENIVLLWDPVSKQIKDKDFDEVLNIIINISMYNHNRM